MKKDVVKKCAKACKNNFWMMLSIALIITLVIAIVAPIGNVSKKTAAEKVIAFAEAQGITAELISVETNGNFYDVTLDINGDTVPVKITKDGKFLAQVTPLEVASTEAPSDPTVTKSDKPIVELFIMTHCPYGTQAEKGFLPAIAALGNSIDASIKFTHFFLHDPEYIETPIQMCIREEQNAKFAPYLTCFLEDGDSDRCLAKTGIDTTALKDCEDNRYDDYYAADSALSEGYGVRGSPTLVINGAQVSAGRSEAAMLTAICSAFNEAPDACNSELNTANPTPGFGWETGNSAAAATAQC